MEKSRITSTINPQNQFYIADDKRNNEAFQESSDPIVNLGCIYYLFCFLVLKLLSKTNSHN